jgi:hypothetical protein
LSAPIFFLSSLIKLKYSSSVNKFSEKNPNPMINDAENTCKTAMFRLSSKNFGQKRLGQKISKYLFAMK